MSSEYDFELFVKRIKALDYYEILTAADAACASAERASFGVRGATAARCAGSTDFVRRIKGFLFFMRNAAIPVGVDPSDLTLYQDVAECLVQKGQLNKEILRLFNPHAK